MGTWLKRIGLGALALVVLCTVVVFAVDAHVRSSAGPRIVSVDEAAALGDVAACWCSGAGCIPTDAQATCWRIASRAASRCTRMARRRSC